MSNIDWNKVDTLLSIIHAAATAGPKYQNIVGLASKELDAEFAAPEEAETTTESEPIDPPSGDGEPGVDATMTTSNGRRL